MIFGRRKNYVKSKGARQQKTYTVSEFLHDFVVLYGEEKWNMSTYDSNTGLIANYINPLIGNVEMQAVNTRFVDQFNRTWKKQSLLQDKTENLKMSICPLKREIMSIFPMMILQECILIRNVQAP